MASKTDHLSSGSGMDEEMGAAEAGGKSNEKTSVMKDMDATSSESKGIGNGNAEEVTGSAGSELFFDATNNHIEDQIKKLEEELGIAVSDDDVSPPVPIEGTVTETKFAETAYTAYTETTIVDVTNKDDEFGNDQDSDNGMLGHMEIIEENIAAIKRLEKRIKVLEKTSPSEQDLDKKYPRDAYSFLALNGPNEGKWPTQRRIFFFFGLLVFVLQCMFFCVLIFSVVNMKRGTSEENDNPDVEEAEGIWAMFATFIPTNTTNVVKVTQVLSLLIYAVFPEDSVKDLVKSFRYYPKSGTKSKEGEPIRFIKLSCILRGLQGILAIVAALILVMTSRTVMDIILNFTALNSISGIDDSAFSLAEAGVFGPSFKKESEFIKEKNLPIRVQRKTKHVIYWKVMGSIVVFYIAFLIFVMASQQSINIWIAKTFRVQFQENQFKEFSGCFRIDGKYNSFNRRNYRSIPKDTSDTTTSFGYCREERYWVFWENKGEDEFIEDACEVNDTIAHSLKTNDFDISTSFDTQWFFPVSNTPFDLFFFDSLTEEDLSCDLSLEDGKCNSAFNRRSYDFDGGDCCAATCNKPLCGKNGVEDVFGVANQTGDGYSDCQDPKMHAVTIQINNISGSREPQYTEGADETWFTNNVLNETEWRSTPPVNPLVRLLCNDREILSVYITPSMLDKSQTVKVEDGAACNLTVRNRTGVGGRVFEGVNEEEPIWYIDYTLFHVDDTDLEEVTTLEILTQSSSSMEGINFQRIPNCYFKKLQDHIDMQTIYTASNSSNEAVRWLMATGNASACEEETFIERYALANMMISMGSMGGIGTIPLLSESNQCSWPSATCYRGQVTQLYLRDQDLQGSLPSEIGLLTELNFLDLANNKNISSLTSEIGLLSKLDKLYLADNMITSLPSEIGLLTNLRDLSLPINDVTMLPNELGSLNNLNGLFFGDNYISFIPTNIGLMTDLTEILMRNNNVTSLPTELGALTNLRKFQTDGNRLTSFMTEIGSMESLLSLAMGYNGIEGAVPSEIGNLEKLEVFQFSSNLISSIPTEIGLLTRLRILEFVNNEVTSIPSEIGLLAESMGDLRFWNNNLNSLPSEMFMLSKLTLLACATNEISKIPSEIGLLSSLAIVQLNENGIKSIPSEVGLLTSLATGYFSRNNITSLPEELGLLTNMRTLWFPSNDLKSIPSEIGLMTSLAQLVLDNNKLTSIPSEMGLLTNLVDLRLFGNQLSSNDIPDGLIEICSSDVANCQFDFNLTSLLLADSNSTSGRQ